MNRLAAEDASLAGQAGEPWTPLRCRYVGVLPLRILGIHDGHNATAALITDGVVEYAIQEERLNGRKNHWGFPQAAITEILHRAGADIADIDHVAMATEDLPRPRDRDVWISRLKNNRGLSEAMKRLLWTTPAYRLQRPSRRKARLLPLLNLGFPQQRVVFVNHHVAHAVAAYLGSPWRDNVLVLTCDGSGDRLSATANLAREGRLHRISQVDESHSLGMVYAMTTFYLGMTPNEDEYKLMGLAPYASEPRMREAYNVFNSLLAFPSSDELVWRRRLGVPNTHHILPRLRRRLASTRFDHVCGGLQRWTEEFLTTWVRNCVRATGMTRVAVGGGVFMNVKANQAISELSEVEQLFCFPSCGDESTAVGAAWAAYSALSAAAQQPLPPVPPIEDIYWGMDFDDDVIEHELRHCNLRYRRSHDIESEVANLLAQGEVVARFKSRQEFGARALGNRSILADPSNAGVVKTINELIKGRDFWMPFACSILDECEHQYIRNPKRIRSPYMMMTYETTDRAREIVAGTHPHDGSVRPQIVYRDWNPDYYRLISEFARRKGIGAVLNTSFNLHGSPIVGAPDAALDVLERSGLRWLAIGNFLVHKGQPGPSFRA